jgi:two-component system sensor histidine kinase KdpD
MSQRPGAQVTRRRSLIPAPQDRAPGPNLLRREVAHTPLARLVRYGGTVAALGLVTAAFVPVRAGIGLLNIGLVFLIVVIGATILAGRWAGLLASVLGFALFNFFLVPPYQTFIVADLQNILALVVFLGVSLLLSRLIGDAREQARLAQRRAEDVSRLYELSQAIIGAERLDDVLPAIAAKVRAVFEVQHCWILLPGPDQQLQARAGARALSRDEQALAEWVFRRGVAAGQEAATPLRPAGAGAEGAAFVPLRAGGRTLGVLGVAGTRDAHPLTAAERTVLGTFADQTAVALERLTLLQEAQRAELLARADELKSALISAVSHDLRTPLASIIAAVTSLLEPEMEWDAATRREFLQGIYDEAERLNRLVGNLLDMSRIESGALRPAQDWYSIDEVITAVVGRLEPQLAPFQVTVDVAPDLPLILLDFTEIDQVLTNLLENALRYTPPGTAIGIAAQRRGQAIEVSVTDSGPGVPPAALPHLFDRFYRVEGHLRPQGLGLGLAISKGLIEAHGGRIMARNRPGGGLQIAFTLPIPAASATGTLPLSAGVSAGGRLVGLTPGGES